MTAKTRRMLGVLGLSASLGLVGVAIVAYATWPANTLGNYLRNRQAHQQIILALERRTSAERDSLTREFYQAWLAEEKGNLAGAIQGFQSLREKARPGTPLHLHSSLRLGLAYGLNRDLEQELATYQGLMDQYPGASRLSQATFYLRRGEAERARVLLDEALGQDEKDGSLGTSRRLAQDLRNGLGPVRGNGPAISH